MSKFRLATFLLTLSLVAIIGLAMSLVARGYRFDPKKFVIKPTGLLVVTSSPDGAQILINGVLESATNATISLAPNTYDVEVKKETFQPWKKRLTVNKEEVTKVDAVLFPAAPSLSALTFSGALQPILSPDGTKVVFGIPAVDKTNTEKVGIWIMDLGNLPIGFSSEPRRISSINPDNSSWQWSPDARQILVSNATGKYLLNSGGYTSQDNLINVQGPKLEKTLSTWKEEEGKKREVLLAKIPPAIQDILERKAKALEFSLDQTKVLYTASTSAAIPDNLIPQLPGSSTQKQERDIKPYQTYVYDIKEDRNFLVLESLSKKPEPCKIPSSIPALQLSCSSTLAWFPTSNHLILTEPDKITIMDYDGTNRQVVWSGPYEAPYAIPFPNTSRLLILTKIGAGNSGFPNLYALGLK